VVAGAVPGRLTEAPALDPGDEYGLEAALQLVETAGEGEVTLISMGPEVAHAALQRGLAMGAHRGVRITDDGLRGADALVTAKVLAAAIERQEFDLVIGGVESTDGYTRSSNAASEAATPLRRGT
jgi:electron transfer flavoprotein beta subunit